MKALLSLVIPTNGMIDWVGEVLDSIYIQNVDEQLFEVVVTDNGISNEFYNYMMNYVNNHSNLIYKRTNAKLFYNQIEGFELANGKFIKFVNHRSRLEYGSIDYLLNFIENNKDEKPITFFLNDSTKITKKDTLYDFNEYVYNLKNYSSWSGGISCWKEDVEKIVKTLENKESLFPHTIFGLFYEHDRNYMINNKKLFSEIDSSAEKKGKYNLFYAFCVEYVDIIKGLYESGKINRNTKKYVLQQNEFFVARLYFEYIVLKKKCSYDLKGYKKYITYSYPLVEIYVLQVICFFKAIKNKLFKRRGGC